MGTRPREEVSIWTSGRGEGGGNRGVLGIWYFWNLSQIFSPFPSFNVAFGPPSPCTSTVLGSTCSEFFVSTILGIISAETFVIYSTIP